MIKSNVAILAVVVLILQIVAVVMNSWSVKSMGNGKKAEWGLWKVCNKNMNKPGEDSCANLPPHDASFPKNSLYLVRVLAILGPILVAIGLYFMYYKTKKDILFAIGGLSSLIASVVWYNELRNMGNIDGNMGVAFVLNSVAGILALVLYKLRN